MRPTPCGALRPPRLPGHSPRPSPAVEGDRAPLHVLSPVTRVPSRPDRAWSDSGGRGCSQWTPSLGVQPGPAGRAVRGGSRGGGQVASAGWAWGAGAGRGAGPAGGAACPEGQRLFYFVSHHERSPKRPRARHGLSPQRALVRAHSRRPAVSERMAPSRGPRAHLRPGPRSGTGGGEAGSTQASPEPSCCGQRHAREAAAARKRRVPGQRRSSGGLSDKLAGFTTARRWQERELFGDNTLRSQKVQYSPPKRLGLLGDPPGLGNPTQRSVRRVGARWP